MEDNERRFLNETTPSNLSEGNLFAKKVTGYDRSPMISEIDFQDLILNYNLLYDETVIDNGNLNKVLNNKNEEFKKIMIDLNDRKRKIDHLKEELGVFKFRFEFVQKFMKEIDNKVKEIGSKTVVSDELYSEQYKTLPSPILDSLKTIAFSNNKTKNSLLKSQEKAKLYYKSLEEKFATIKNEQSKTYDCVRCSEKFSVDSNSDVSCIYHIGKIKYFSCIGCGQDQYYSCCRNCKNCKKGCKYGKHVK